MSMTRRGFGQCCVKIPSGPTPPPCLAPTITLLSVPPFNPRVDGHDPGPGATSPPDVDPDNGFPSSCRQSGASVVTVTFDQAVTNVTVKGNPLGTLGTMDFGNIAPSPPGPFPTNCVECAAVVPVGTQSVIVTPVGAVVSITPNGPPFYPNLAQPGFFRQYRFIITAERLDSPGCPATFGPFCFGMVTFD